jgi:general secretion pathway protein D
MTIKNKITALAAQAGWRQMGAAALLFGALFALSPPPLASAAEAAAGEANLNFVGADIDTVIKAVGQYTNITFVIDPRV